MDGNKTNKAPEGNPAPKKQAAKRAVRKASAVPKKATAKKSTAKKAASKAAPRKASAKRATTKKAARKSAVKEAALAAATGQGGNLAGNGHASKPTTIIVRCDAGYGNQLFLRGQGPGLSWDQGVAMRNISADEWVWTAPAANRTIELKVLLNDNHWSAGENITVPAGARQVLFPAF